jgi:hypothetical protein
METPHSVEHGVQEAFSLKPATRPHADSTATLRPSVARSSIALSRRASEAQPQHVEDSSCSSNKLGERLSYDILYKMSSHLVSLDFLSFDAELISNLPEAVKSSYLDTF